MARGRKTASATPAKRAPSPRKTRQPGPSDRDDPAVARPAPRLPSPRGLYAIHYSSDLSNTVGLPRQISAIVVQNVLTEKQHTFSVIDIAQELRCSPDRLHTRFDEFERVMLKRFSAFVRNTPKGTRLHWGMRKANFGFDVILQRMCAHRVQKPAFAERRLFDLSAYLKLRYGDSFAAQPRLINAAKLNGCWEPTFLTQEESAAAWSNGEYAKLVQSLSDKVDAISDLYWHVKNGTFRCALSSPSPLPSHPLASETVDEAPPAPHSGVGSASKSTPAKTKTQTRGQRPCYERDHTFLAWYNEVDASTYHSYARIRDRWNREHPKDPIGDGQHGRDLVKKGLKAAERDGGKL